MRGGSGGGQKAYRHATHMGRSRRHPAAPAWPDPAVTGSSRWYHAAHPHPPPWHASAARCHGTAASAPQSPSHPLAACPGGTAPREGTAAQSRLRSRLMWGRGSAERRWRGGGGWAHPPVRDAAWARRRQPHLRLDGDHHGMIGIVQNDVRHGLGWEGEVIQPCRHLRGHTTTHACGNKL